MWRVQSRGAGMDYETQICPEEAKSLRVLPCGQSCFSNLDGAYQTCWMVHYHLPTSGGALYNSNYPVSHCMAWRIEPVMVTPQVLLKLRMWHCMSWMVHVLNSSIAIISLNLELIKKLFTLYVCAMTYMGSRRQFGKVSSLLPCGVQGLNSGHQA